MSSMRWLICFERCLKKDDDSALGLGFFERRPEVLFPIANGGLVPLAGPALRMLPTPAQLHAQNPPYMAGTILDLEPFADDFLGYTFGPHCFEKEGRWYLGASPSKKSVARIKQKVGDLVPNNVEAWSEVRDRLNQILRGWCAYFRYGTTAKAYQAVDYYVYDSVRHYLRRRHQVQSRGNTRFSRDAVYGRLGVVQLRRVRMAFRS
jgi:RNA-directed DNA polymerase